MKIDTESILKELKSLSEKKYKIFNSKIVPTKQIMLGVRVPILRKMAQQIVKEDALSFIELDKQHIYEMLLLEGIVLSYMHKSFLQLAPLVENYLNKVDSWAQVDIPISSFKSINKDRKSVYEIVLKWLHSDKEYLLRSALVILLNYYVEEEYLQKIFKISQELTCEAYYVTMANAWLLSVCMVKFPEQTIEFFKNNTLDKNTHKKAIQKSLESFRVSKDNKLILQKLKTSI